jgi:hypothetical protein
MLEEELTYKTTPRAEDLKKRIDAVSKPTGGLEKKSTVQISFSIFRKQNQSRNLLRLQRKK